MTLNFSRSSSISVLSVRGKSFLLSLAFPSFKKSSRSDFRLEHSKSHKSHCKICLVVWVVTKNLFSSKVLCTIFFLLENSLYWPFVHYEGQEIVMWWFQDRRFLIVFWSELDHAYVDRNHVDPRFLFPLTILCLGGFWGSFSVRVSEIKGIILYFLCSPTF